MRTRRYSITQRQAESLCAALTLAIGQAEEQREHSPYWNLRKKAALINEKDRMRIRNAGFKRSNIHKADTRNTDIVHSGKEKQYTSLK